MRPTDALITGFCKAPQLALQAIAPLRRLHRQGHIRNIHYVTWDNPDLDPHIAPIADNPEIQITRVPQPDAQGHINWRGVVYQVRNLEAALALVPEDDALVLKTRLDFVPDTDFLRSKIMNFDTLCAPVSNIAPNGVPMPAPVLGNKIWIPWADSNQPFFYEDALFLGVKRDIQKLVTPLNEADEVILSIEKCGSYGHAVRFAKIFLARWPLFHGYLRHYDVFVNDFSYRTRLLAVALEDGFFWHLLIAHAWILYSQFHVDSGQPGELRFYANNVNRHADWSRPETLKPANPYDHLPNWRSDTRPGEAAHSVRRTYGRLVDDAWHTALFTQPLPDLPAEILANLMSNTAASHDGRLAGIERDCYAALDKIYRGYWGKAA
ncbi:MAG TPA: hypothetical protein VGM68_04220 [Rhizomicrobium sp.]